MNKFYNNRNINLNTTDASKTTHLGQGSPTQEDRENRESMHFTDDQTEV